MTVEAQFVIPVAEGTYDRMSELNDIRAMTRIQTGA